MMEFPDPTPGPDEVVVEMKASGMCGQRPAPVPPAEDQRRRQCDRIAGQPEPGDRRPRTLRRGGRGRARRRRRRKRRSATRVMVHHYQGCTQCNHCRSGWQQLCQEVPVKVYGSNSHGGHAKYLQGAGEHAGAAGGRTDASPPARRSRAAPARPTARCGGCNSPATTRSRSSARGRSVWPARSSPRRWERG